MNVDSQLLSARELPTAERFIEAPAEAVFDAWITASLVETWWGPDGFSTKVHELDARPAGRYAFEMIAPSGNSCMMSGHYRTVERPHLLVFEVSDHCNLDLPGDVEAQTETSLVTVKFAPKNGKTHVLLTHTDLNRDYSWLAVASWAQSLEKSALALFTD